MIATSAAVAEAAVAEAVRVAPAPRRPTLKQALAKARPGDVLPARDGVRPVALVVLHDRRAYAVDDACPHDGGSLSDGFLDGDRLVCARHGWEIDPCSGACGRQRIDARFVGVVR